jgi:hypothetical protein
MPDRSEENRRYEASRRSTGDRKVTFWLSRIDHKFLEALCKHMNVSNSRAYSTAVMIACERLRVKLDL